MLDLDFHSAYLAVDLFFCLSGFVICKSYEAKLNGDLQVGHFMAIRLVRLYPLYSIAVSIAVAQLIVDTLLFRSELAADAAVLTAWFAFALLPVPPGLAGVNHLFPLCPPAWSLYLELLVNAVYGAVSRWLTLRRIAAVLAGSAATLAVASWWFHGLDTGYGWHNALGGIPRVAFSFFLGVALYRSRHFMSFRVRHGALVAMAMVAVVLSVPVPYSLRPVYDVLAIVLAFPAIILIGSMASDGPRVSRYCFVLGELSYPLYVLHIPVLAAFVSGWNKAASAPPDDAGSVSGALFLIVLVLLSGLVLNLVDGPLRQELRRRLFQPKPVSAI